MNGSVAIRASNGTEWSYAQLEEFSAWAGPGTAYYMDEVCNTAIRLLESECAGGVIQIFIQNSILKDSLVLRNNVEVDFCGGRCYLFANAPLVRIENCSFATIRNAKVYPFSPGSFGESDHPQTAPVILLAATSGGASRHNRIESIKILQVTSGGYESCRYDTRCAKTYSWQEHPGVLLYHETDGIIESNCIHKLSIDGVRAAVEFYTADNSKSSARCNLISDIHSDHARSMIRS